MSKTDEISQEQNFFDAAVAAREAQRERLSQSHLASGGNNKVTAQIKADSARNCAKLGRPEDPVAEGWIEDENGRRRYIGRHVISTQDKDILVIGWKAPAAEPFYRATPSAPLGLACKRTITAHRNTVLDFDDLIFADIAERVEALHSDPTATMDDALLNDLGRSREGSMRDIVKTIQAAQYDIVSAPLDRLMIVQGGPGTGKTAVALHRVSYLLFNNENLRASDCLVIGPNPLFTTYISQVLPDLGDSDVHHRDLTTLGPQVEVTITDRDETARLKGDARMAHLLKRSLEQRIGLRTETVQLGPDHLRLTFTRDDIAQLIKQARTNATYNAGRTAFRNLLRDRAFTKAKERRAAFPQTDLDTVVDRIWPSLSAPAFLRDLLGSTRRLNAAGENDFTAAELELLHRQAEARLGDQRWSPADIALLDEAAHLLEGAPRRYSYLVVDEAQDLSPMQLRSVRRRSKTGWMTLVGDVAQSTGQWARDSWDDVINSLSRTKVEHTMVDLTLGYRVPRQVFEFAAKLLPVAAPSVSEPRVVRQGLEAPRLVDVAAEDYVVNAVAEARRHAAEGRFTGIIHPDRARAGLEDALRDSGLTWSDASAGELDTNINLVPMSSAKGLEFDAVIVVDPAGIVEESTRGHRQLYIAYTRTTQYLSVVHTGDPLLLPGAAPESGSQAELISEQDLLEPEVAPVAPTVDTTSAKPAPVSPTTVIPRQATGPSPNLRAAVIAATAEWLASEISGTVTPDCWEDLLDQVRLQLRQSASSEGRSGAAG